MLRVFHINRGTYSHTKIWNRQQVSNCPAYNYPDNCNGYALSGSRIPDQAADELKIE